MKRSRVHYDRANHSWAVFRATTDTPRPRLARQIIVESGYLPHER